MSSRSRGVADGPLLVLGAGYLGAALAEQALGRGHEVVLADNWYATEREQLTSLETRGARVETVDVRRRDDVDRVLAERPSRVYLFAAQASRPLSWSDPEYTEQVNLSGPRVVAEAVLAAGGPPLAFASSLHVYGPGLSGEIGPAHPYGAQGDLAHLSKIYGELCLRLFSKQGDGFDLAIFRLGILYGPSPVEHERPESQTVVDRFRRLAARREPLPMDDPEAAVGVVHVLDAARILLDEGGAVSNVAAETVTVGDVAALARGEEPRGRPAFRYSSPYEYRHQLADYLRA